MKVQFLSRSWAKYLNLHAAEPKLFAKVNALIEECRRQPFRGTSKPGSLGGNLSGWWSRRISHEQQVVYRVARSGEKQVLQITQCRYHY